MFKKFYPVLCQGVYNILKDKDLSEDIVQEVFIKIWDKRNTLEIHDNFIFYLKKACHNATLNVISAVKTSTVSTEKLEIAGNSGSDEKILNNELDLMIAHAIAELPERTRLVFTLSRYENMSYKQIADELQVSVKAVEKHMGIALARLRVSLKDYLYLLLISFLTRF